MASPINEYIARIESERGHRAAIQTRYFLSDISRVQLTPKGLDAYRGKLKAARKLSPSSINRKLSAVRGYLLWLQRTEQVKLSKSAITDNLGFYRANKRKLTLPDAASVRRLIMLAAERPGIYGTMYCRFIALGLFAGLRPGEIEALRGTDIPGLRQYIHVKRTKTGVERHAYFEASAVLANTLPRLGAFDARLVTSGCVQWFPAAAEAAGMGRVSRNVLRKLHASYMACSGKYSEYWLCQHLGHSSAVSIKHYRDPEILNTIQPGTTVEQWMGLDDCSKMLVRRMMENLPKVSG